MIPTPAAAAGYSVQTFGPDLELGATWFNNNFYRPPVAGQSIQNGDGTVLLPIGGNGYGICSAQLLDAKSGRWQGTAFGGGFFIEAVLSWPTVTIPQNLPWPAFWANPIEGLSTVNASVSGVQWPKQAWGYEHSVEIDVMEQDWKNATQYGTGMHDWYGATGAVQQVQTAQPVTLIAPQTFDKPNRYGFLTIPATATSPGIARWFFNGVQTGTDQTWALYDSTLAPPPVLGTSAFSVLDSLHYALMLQTCNGCPLTVHQVSVWQASVAGNISQ